MGGGGTMIMTFRGSIKCGKFVVRLSSVSNCPIVNTKMDGLYI